ncbi:MmgE/PrpD family protein [Brucella pseudintermedia]|uniref:MmgE/PrpD family protein n=1 Tax=Brucella pseudintermedia TaxID=370111 RepID=A0ABY5UG38_9HYPH|nr:MmgE/PrpD family protein [Brucella pseudintermedia]UWL61861.1 MmgE/PrpD family protein [Brucella pseudintermedia]
MDIKAPSQAPDQDISAKLLAVLADQAHLPVSQAERHAAVTTIGDTIGVMLAGAADVRSRRLLSTMATVPHGASGLSRLPGGNMWASPTDVALALGFSAHLLDFDDDETEIAMAHLSAPCLPAALAIAGQAGGEADGAALIDAYVAGCQTMLALGRAVNPALYKAGWHATSVLGAFGAASAAARLLHLTRQQTVHAFGLVASLASGPRGAFGGEGKPLQVGQAAASGVRAALLAQAGWASAPGALAGMRGVLTRMVGDFNVVYDEALSPFPPMGFVTKPYPSCTATHAAVAEVLSLMAQQTKGRDASTMRSLHCAVDPFVPQILIGHVPASADEGRFSLPYCLAVAAVHGSLGLPAFTTDAFSVDGPGDAAVKALMSRIVITSTDDLPKGPSGISTGAVIRIEWQDGLSVEGRRDAGPGSTLSPLSDADLRAKFGLCTAGFLENEHQDALWRHILTLAEAPSAGAFIDTLPAIFTLQGQDR